MMEDGLCFSIFRQMHLVIKHHSAIGSVFVVRFQFKKFSHKINMRLSRIPILLIAGSPGFQNKIWMIDWKTGYWQGVYQFENATAIEKYKKSFVLGMMNKRAVSETITYQVLPDTEINEFIQGISLD